MSCRYISFQLDGKKVNVFQGPEDGKAVYLNCFGDDPEKMGKLLESGDIPPCHLVLISDIDWENDMTPWYCPPVFKNGGPYAGKADEYLAWMREALIPETERRAGVKAPAGGRCIAGYSLAGLFAVYSLLASDLFSRGASMSGSLWYPDLLSFVESHEFVRKPECVYFSVGDREKRSCIDIFRHVEENTEKIEQNFASRGVKTIFELNRGNHYQEPDIRTAKGLRWMLNSR